MFFKYLLKALKNRIACTIPDQVHTVYPVFGLAGSQIFGWLGYPANSVSGDPLNCKFVFLFWVTSCYGKGGKGEGIEGREGTTNEDGMNHGGHVGRGGGDGAMNELGKQGWTEGL